jgi:hypothetical protein
MELFTSHGEQSFAQGKFTRQDDVDLQVMGTLGSS